MPGTSHEIEGSLLNELHPRTFDVVRELVNYHELENIILYMKHGVPKSLMQQYPRIPETEWNQIIKKVCLTRLTAIKISEHYPEELVRFLLSTALECLNCENCAIKGALSKVSQNQIVLAIWLSRTFKILENNQKAG